MSRIAAIFDIDNTVFSGITEGVLIKFLFRKNKIRFKNYFVLLFWFVFYRLHLIKDVSRIREYAAKLFKNWDIEETKELMNECFEREIRKRIFPQSISIIEEHKKRGELIVLSTASFNIIAELYKAFLKADCLISTQLGTSSGKLTGKIDGLINYGSNKVKLIKALSKKMNIDLNLSCVYADHISDVDLFRVVGNCIVVNPDSNLRKIAEKNNWRILSLRGK